MDWVNKNWEKAFDENLAIFRNSTFEFNVPHDHLCDLIKVLDIRLRVIERYVEHQQKIFKAVVDKRKALYKISTGKEAPIDFRACG